MYPSLMKIYREIGSYQSKIRFLLIVIEGCQNQIDYYAKEVKDLIKRGDGYKNLISRDVEIINKEKRKITKFVRLIEKLYWKLSDIAKKNSRERISA